MDKAIIDDVLEKKDAQLTRKLALKILNNFKELGFNDTQMLEARAEAAKAVSMGRVFVARGFLTDEDARSVAFQKPFIALTEELLANSNKAANGTSVNTGLKVQARELPSNATEQFNKLIRAASSGKDAAYKDLVNAIETGRVESVKIALSKGADPNCNKEGELTPLQLAAMGGLTEIAKALLDAKADVNRKGYQKNTALLFAVAEGSVKMVTLLLSKGADPNIGDEEGLLPLHQAILAKKDRKIVKDCWTPKPM